ncbi:MAG: GNAT family N-acetyltransferase [Lachnospiraceae bacterium]
MLKGKRVYLDTVEPDDLEQLRKWRNLPNFRKYFREYQEINSDMQKKWYDAKVVNDNSTLMFTIRDNKTQELLGCCGLCYINWVHRNSDLSLYIGKDESYIDDEGIAEEACQLLFDYGFKEINLKKIWTELYEFDHKKINLYQKLGMTIDGTWRDQYFYDGKWWDSLLLEIIQEEYLS